MLILCLEGKDLIFGTKHIDKNTKIAPQVIKIGMYEIPLLFTYIPTKNEARINDIEPHNRVLP